MVLTWGSKKKLINLCLRSWCRSLFLQQTADRQLEASARRRQISRHFEHDFWLMMMKYIHYEIIMELNDTYNYWFLSKTCHTLALFFFPFRGSVFSFWVFTSAVTVNLDKFAVRTRWKSTTILLAALCGLHSLTEIDKGQRPRRPWSNRIVEGTSQLTRAFACHQRRHVTDSGDRVSWTVEHPPAHQPQCSAGQINLALDTRRRGIQHAVFRSNSFQRTQVDMESMGAASCEDLLVVSDETQALDCWSTGSAWSAGLDARDHCYLCDQAPETIDHIIACCLLTREVWHFVLQAVGLHLPQGAQTTISWWRKLRKLANG